MSNMSQSRRHGDYSDKSPHKSTLSNYLKNQKHTATTFTENKQYESSVKSSKPFKSPKPLNARSKVSRKVNN